LNPEHRSQGFDKKATISGLEIRSNNRELMPDGLVIITKVSIMLKFMINIPDFYNYQITVSV
jgi:hypothetical protein